MALKTKTIAAHTLGCKVNQLETESLLEVFRTAGYRVVNFDTPADIYLINTCTITHLGDRKSRQMIRRAQRCNPEAMIVVTGCYAQRSPEAVQKIPGVSLIWGNQDRAEIVNWVEQLFAQKSANLQVEDQTEVGLEALIRVKDIRQAQVFEELPLALERDRTRALVKVEDGCSQFCSYCIVPYTRGPVRSRPAERVVEETIRLVEAGYQEVVLTGIHTSAYGKEWRYGGDTPNLATLIQKILEAVPALPRLRISSIEPTEMPERLLEIMSQSKVICRHLHIPLQSGDDEILRQMRRPYTTAQYAALIQRLRRKISGVAVTTDIMVGFPGETEQHFNRSFNFIYELGFSDLHVFKYSPRQGTLAAALPNQVAAPDKEARSQQLIALAHDLRQRFAASFVGQTLEVLLEEETTIPKESNWLPERDMKTAFWGGYTDNYIRVAVPVVEKARLSGRFVPVLLVDSQADLVLGKII